MQKKDKRYSDIQRYEIININDAEKYGCLFNHDLIIDKYGNFKFIALSLGRVGNPFFKTSKQFCKIPWNSIKKIGSKTIIIDFDNIDENLLDSDVY